MFVIKLRGMGVVFFREASLKVIGREPDNVIKGFTTRTENLI